MNKLKRWELAIRIMALVTLVISGIGIFWGNPYKTVGLIVGSIMVVLIFIHSRKIKREKTKEGE
ncbi:MAG: hypothetical protein FWD32_01140 [Firmicutes bacterium]|nr:hypothetical protein [Bacillota bacterium]